MRQFHFDFLLFFRFLDRIFSKVFPNPFIVHSRPSFLFERSFHFSLVVFCSHAAFLHRFSVVFYFFDLIFFRNGFPNSPIVRSRSSFFKLIKILRIVRQDFSCYVFFYFVE